MKLFKYFLLCLTFAAFTAAGAFAQRPAAPKTAPAAVKAAQASASSPARQGGGSAAATQPAANHAAKPLGELPKVKLAQEFVLIFVLPASASGAAYDPASVNTADFEVLGTSQEIMSDGSVQFTFKLMPFALGDVKFTSVTWTSVGGQKFTSPELTIKINKVDTGIKSDEIIDIRGPIRYVDWWLWAVILLITSILAAVGILIYDKYRDRSGDKEAKFLPKPDNRPLEVIAKERIDRVVHSGLWENAEYKKFYTGLSDILRWYLEKRYGIITEYQTTAELLRAVKKTDAKILEEIKRFCTSSDLVKFAKLTPTSQMRAGDIKLLEFIIDRSTPAATLAREVRS